MYKILIVEDDRVIADKMKEHLEKWDYEVARVQDFKRVQEESMQQKKTCRADNPRFQQ